MTHTVVIPRVAPRRAWADPSTPVVDLVLPCDPAGYGRIAMWDPQGGHCEASDAYYLKTRAPRTPAERAEAARLVAEYRAIMQSYGDAPVVERQRRPADWRRHAWVTSF